MALRKDHFGVQKYKIIFKMPNWHNSKKYIFTKNSHNIHFFDIN